MWKRSAAALRLSERHLYWVNMVVGLPLLKVPLQVRGTELARGLVPLAKRGEPKGGGCICKLCLRSW